MDGDADARLTAAFHALSHPARLALLRQTRRARALAEIRLEGGPDAGRVLARQTVKDHVDRLLAAGLLTMREAERPFGRTLEYALNHQTLFALAEEVRELARIPPEDEPEIQTRAGAPARPAGVSGGPCLVLVKGLGEGRTFPLDAGGASRRAWVIGRRRGAEIPLDFDPFVSSENALVQWQEGAYSLVNVPESRNGTLVNFQPLPPGARHRLRAADLIGVGRTILMFRE